MNFCKKLFTLSFGFLCMMTMTAFSSPLVQEEDVQEIPPFALITIPKSGSHMLMKALTLLTGALPLWHTKFPSLFCIPGNEGYLYTHFCVPPGLEDDYEGLPCLRKIVMIRDLRDVCVSIVHQIYKSSWPGLTAMQRHEFLAMPFDQQLTFVINYEYDVYEVAAASPDSLQLSLVKIAQQAQQYCQDRRNLVCTYENLVGPHGGGSNESQMNELNNIAQFLELSINDEKLQNVAEVLYGNEADPFGKGLLTELQSTFLNGKVGNWKTVFKEEHKQAFKAKLGPALIALGYEQDDNW